MKKNATLAVIMTAICICISAVASAQNVLVNADFETSPPSTCGNYFPGAISPWVFGTGSPPNWVTVDGGSSCHYGNNGPKSDASAPGAGIKQHYLDIKNGTNDFYQSFTPQCSGTVVFGGSFSTRADSSGTASVTLRQGVGTSGTIVGQTNTITLPAGKSETDPWTPVSYSVPITAGTTYSYIVHMDNNMNFDNGFVRYELACGTTTSPVTTCCPPVDKLTVQGMFMHQGNSASTFLEPLDTNSAATTSFVTGVNAYLAYLHIVCPQTVKLKVEFFTGPVAAPVGNGPAGPLTGTDLTTPKSTAWVNPTLTVSGLNTALNAGTPGMNLYAHTNGVWYRIAVKITGIGANGRPVDCGFNAPECATDDTFGFAYFTSSRAAKMAAGMSYTQ
jgi:hypothetical protein